MWKKFNKEIWMNDIECVVETCWVLTIESIVIGQHDNDRWKETEREQL